jgi:endonuclease/exonuclease/phosphatase (EEP) superfamily protein YafD
VTVRGIGSRIAAGISWAVAGGLAAWAVARVTAADRVRRIEAPVAPLLSFTPQAAAAAPAAAVALALAGRRGPAATAALAAAVLAVVVGPRAVRRPQPAASGPVLRVLTVNLLVGRADAGAVVALVRRTGADVLFLQELSADAVARLKQAGLGDLMPREVTEFRGGLRGSGIYSRFPLTEGPLAPARAARPAAVLELPGGEAVELACVHPRPPKPPWPQGVARWRQQLAELPPPGDLPRVLAGDFNATLDHAVFRSVLRLGYADAALQAANALAPTWGPAGRLALITIDHVLVDQRCAVRASSVHAIPGTDHRAVYAEVQLPGQQPAPDRLLWARRSRSSDFV